jgi:predicted acetyltransferase
VPVEIRHPILDEAADYLRAVNTAFLQPTSRDEPMAQYWADVAKPDLDRSWAAFDRGRAVGSLRSLPFEVTVPGGRTVPGDGVTMVTVAPTHRRRGLLTGMMSQAQQDAKDRGDAVSVLIASEWRIYGRFGFGPATEAVEWSVDRRQAGAPSPRGDLELVSTEELRLLAPPVYDRARLRRAGGLTRPEIRWDRDFGLLRIEGASRWEGRATVHRDPEGEVDGYLRWTAGWSDTGLDNVLTVDELTAATDEAYADLWRFALSVDLIATVKAESRPVDEALPWLLPDGRAVRQTERYDYLWLRVLDVPAALTGRDYLSAGRVVLQVVDPVGHAAGRFVLDASPAGATCAPTTESADITLPATTLGSAYLGGHRLGTLAAAGLVDEHTPGAVGTADRLLGFDQAPWCTLHF